jgi:hypothetical protein
VTKKLKPPAAVERGSAAHIARLTGFSIRKVQQYAAQGKIPTAARLAGSCWTFNLAAVRVWIKKGEDEVNRTSPPSSTAAPRRRVSIQRRDRCRL